MAEYILNKSIQNLPETEGNQSPDRTINDETEITDELVSTTDDEESEELIEISNRTDRVRNHNLQLAERCESLHNTLDVLKSKLAKEKELWVQEMEEANKYNQLDAGDAHGTPRCYECYSKSNESLNDVFDYEHTLLKYQDNFAQMQADKVASIRKQIAVNDFQRRLLEVETMCNMELRRVERNFEYLEPLQAMASGWNNSKLATKYSSNLDKECSSSLEDNVGGGDKNSNLYKDIAATLESFGDKINCEVNEMFTKLANECNIMPQITMSSVTSAALDIQLQ